MGNEQSSEQDAMRDDAPAAPAAPTAGESVPTAGGGADESADESPLTELLSVMEKFYQVKTRTTKALEYHAYPHDDLNKVKFHTVVCGAYGAIKIGIYGEGMKAFLEVAENSDRVITADGTDEDREFLNLFKFNFAQSEIAGKCEGANHVGDLHFVVKDNVIVSVCKCDFDVNAVGRAIYTEVFGHPPGPATFVATRRNPNDAERHFAFNNAAPNSNDDDDEHDGDDEHDHDDVDPVRAAALLAMVRDTIIIRRQPQTTESNSSENVPLEEPQSHTYEPTNPFEE
jgi:hypothetical protein